MGLTSGSIGELQEIVERRALDADFRGLFEPVLAYHARVQEDLPAHLWEAIEKCTAILRRKLGRRGSDSLDDHIRLLIRLLIAQDLFVHELLAFYRERVGPINLLPNGRKSWPKVGPKPQCRAKRRRRERRG